VGKAEKKKKKKKEQKQKNDIHPPSCSRWNAV
jgi:hypothetical protein